MGPLSFAAFFEHYDYALLSIAAPVLSRGLDVTPSRFGLATSIVRLAGLAAVVLVRVADRVGRRRMLLWTLSGFIACTALTAGAWDLASFIVASFVARLFLTAEGALSGIVISEEVHATRRGRALSIAGLLGQTAYGAVAVLIAVLPSGDVGWRLLYLFALAPLAVVAALRRRLPETHAFRVAEADQRTTGRVRLGRRWWPRTLAAVTVFGLLGAFQTAAAYHAAQLAQTTYGWTGTYTLVIVLSGPFTLAGFLLGGRGSDRLGRRPLIASGFVLGAAGMALVFLGGRAAYAPGWFAFVVGQAIVAGCWLAFLSELVPTEVRATVTSVVVSAQVATGAVGLALSSALGDSPRDSGAVVVWLGGAAVASVVLLTRLPETSGRDVVAAYHPAD